MVGDSSIWFYCVEMHFNDGVPSIESVFEKKNNDIQGLYLYKLQSLMPLFVYLHRYGDRKGINWYNWKYKL